MTNKAIPTSSKLEADSVENDTNADEFDNDDCNNLIAQIMEELNSNPPIKCSISYTGLGDEETINNIMVQLQIQAFCLKQKHSWLNFDDLDSIVFHSDYSLALREISERTGRICQATNEPSGIGIAMVVPLEKKCAVIFDAGVALSIIDESDPERKNLCLDTILHELCHVYDYGRKRRLLQHEFLIWKISPINSHVFNAAESAWSEYFANKYSNSTYSSPNMHPQYLSEVVPSVVEDIRNAIKSYRTHAKLDELLQFCVKKICFLFQSFGYALGRLSANSTSLEQVAPSSVAALRSAGFWDLWLAIVGELDRLDERRESWTSFDELKTLMALVDDVFKVLGIHYSESNGRVMVNIPYTPETMP
jgi:hypothetical protein